MSLERWLHDKKNWVEGTGTLLERLLKETSRGLEQVKLPGDLEKLSHEITKLADHWANRTSDTIRRWSSHPSRALEDMDEFSSQLQGEWSRMAEMLQLGDRYRDAIRTLATLYLRTRFHEHTVTGLEEDERKARSAQLHKRNALELADLCRRQGGAWIKAAQFISCQGDWVPEQYRLALTELQDRAPSIPWESVNTVLKEEWEADWEERFSEIDHDPVATASLAQVHRAVLPDGTPVALKVQLPDAPAKIDADLRFFALAARLLEDKESGLDLRQIVRELSSSIMSELDYRREAANLTRFRERYDNDEWMVPVIFPKLVTDRTLGMRYIEGTPVRLFLQDAPSAAYPVLKILVGSFIKQIFHSGLFHADPHPGNFFVTPKGKLALLDFGAVVELNPEESRSYRDLLTALLTRQSDGFELKLERAGFKVPEPKRLKELLFNEKRETSGNLTQLKRHLEIMRELKVEIPDSFVLMARVLISLGGLMNQHGVRLTPLDWSSMLRER